MGLESANTSCCFDSFKVLTQMLGANGHDNPTLFYLETKANGPFPSFEMNNNGCRGCGNFLVPSITTVPSRVECKLDFFTFCCFLLS